MTIGEAPPRARPTLVNAAVVLAAAGAVAAVYAVSVGSDRGRSFDHRARFAAYAENGRVDMAVGALLDIVVPLAAAALAVLIARFAVIGTRRRILMGLGVFAGANLATQGLKALLGATDPIGGEALRQTTGAFPSGHAAIATSVVVAALVALPRLGTPTVVIGGAFAVAVSVALVVAGWHYPSDIVAANLIPLAAIALVPGIVSARPVRHGLIVGTAMAVPLAVMAAASAATTDTVATSALVALGSVAVAASAAGTIIAARSLIVS